MGKLDKTIQERKGEVVDRNTVHPKADKQGAPRGDEGEKATNTACSERQQLTGKTAQLRFTETAIKVEDTKNQEGRPETQRSLA